MKLPRLLYNKTGILISLCLHSSLYCPLLGAAVVGGNKTWHLLLERPGSSTNITPRGSATVDRTLGVLFHSHLYSVLLKFSLQGCPRLGMQRYMSNVLGIYAEHFENSVSIIRLIRI